MKNQSKNEIVYAETIKVVVQLEERSNYWISKLKDKLIKASLSARFTINWFHLSPAPISFFFKFHKKSILDVFCFEEHTQWRCLPCPLFSFFLSDLFFRKNLLKLVVGRLTVIFKSGALSFELGINLGKFLYACITLKYGFLEKSY